jgi:hypothetical protein
LVTTSLAPSRLIALYTEYSSVNTSSEGSGISHTTKRKFGPKLPSIKEKGKLASFRRVKVVYSKEPILDSEEANRRMEANPNDAEANAFLGLDMIRTAQDLNSHDFAENAIDHLEAAILSGKLIGMPPLGPNTKELPRRTQCRVLVPIGSGIYAASGL